MSDKMGIGVQVGDAHLQGLRVQKQEDQFEASLVYKMF